MASSYTGLGTELMTTGENAGNWGTKTNTNLQIIEQLAGGYIEKAVTSTPTALSVSDGSTGAELSHRIIKFTGTISADTVVTVPLDVQQMYILMNGTSGNYTVTFKYITGSGSTVVFQDTDKGTKIVYATADDGTNPNLVDTGISTNTISGVTGDITLDSPVDIILDADGADIFLKDGGTLFGTFTNTGGQLVVKSSSSGTTALTFSGANATFAGTLATAAGGFNVAGLDIDGATDIGADIVDADLFIIDDGAGGTNRKTTASRLKTYIGGGTSWQAVKTGAFTAAAGEGYFVNTTSSAFTATLPAGTIGDEISFIDYAGTFDSNNLTVDQDGSEKIHGSTDALTVATERAAFTLVFTDSTQGWLLKDK